MAARLEAKPLRELDERICGPHPHGLTQSMTKLSVPSRARL